MKRIVLLGLVLLLVFLVSGCSSSRIDELGDLASELEEALEGEELEEFREVLERVAQLEKDGVPGELAAVVEHFEREGLDVEDVHIKLYEMIGAVGGIGVTIEGADVELYLFNPATADENLVRQLEEAQETGVLRDPETETELPVIMNGDIMLLGLEMFGYEHPAKDKVAAAFRSF